MTTTFHKGPVRYAKVIINSAYSVHMVPMARDYFNSVPIRHATIVNMVWFGAGSVKFEDTYVFTCFQVFNRGTFEIISSKVKMPYFVTETIKHSIKLLVNFRLQINKS